MKLFSLVAVVMIAFAANSILSRAAIFEYHMDAKVFAGLRLASGAVMLAILVVQRGQGWPELNRGRVLAAVALLVYLIPFSIAYSTLPSGVGALILFGFVQLTMFAGSAMTGMKPTVWQWSGMSLAMVGLAWLLWPTDGLRLNAIGVSCMVLAGIGWGVFSLRGRGSSTPLGDMAWSFVLCLPVAIGLMVFGGGWSGLGLILAIISGAVTSGLGYALWYHVLPQMAATTGAVAQLSVPVIALIAGAFLLNEGITLQVVFASAVALGGIAFAVFGRTKQ